MNVILKTVCLSRLEDILMLVFQLNLMQHLLPLIVTSKDPTNMWGCINCDSCVHYVPISPKESEFVFTGGCN